MIILWLLPPGGTAHFSPVSAEDLHACVSSVQISSPQRHGMVVIEATPVKSAHSKNILLNYGIIFSIQSNKFY